MPSIFSSRTNVKVRRNSDGVEMTMPYKAFHNIRDSQEEAGGAKFNKITLIGESDADGQIIAGNPHLHESDIKNIGVDPSAGEITNLEYQG